MGNKSASQGNMSPQMKTGTRPYNRSFSAPCVMKRSVSKADITFHVGEEPDTWRIPAEKNVLADANPVFRAMFVGPLAETHATTVQIPDVEGRGFECLVNFLYKEPIKFRSVATALETLHAAQKYLCSNLTELCVQYLNEYMTVDNALHILRHVMIYASTTHIISSETQSCSLPPIPVDEKPVPSAPPLEHDENDHVEVTTCLLPQPQIHFRKRGFSETCEHALNQHPSHETNFTNWCTVLLRQTFDFIDANGSAILATEDVEDLPRHVLEAILERDSLNAREVEVLDALIRWASCECKRQKLEETVKNRRLVLGDLIWQVRFLAMDAEEFLIGPVASGMLTLDEHVPLINYLQGHLSQSQLSDELQRYMPRLATKRCTLPEPLLSSLPVSTVAAGTTAECPNNPSESSTSHPLIADDTNDRRRVKNPRMMEKFFVCLACIFE